MRFRHLHLVLLRHYLMTLVLLFVFITSLGIRTNCVSNADGFMLFVTCELTTSNSNSCLQRVHSSLRGPASPSHYQYQTCYMRFTFPFGVRACRSLNTHKKISFWPGVNHKWDPHLCPTRIFIPKLIWKELFAVACH